MGLFLEPFNASKYESIRMNTKEQWGVLIHKDAPLAKQDAIHPGDLVGTLVITIHINTPTQLELAEWSGDFAKEMDFSVNYNVLHNAVIVAREQKGAVICLKLDCSYEDMKFLPLEPKLELGSILAWKNIPMHSKVIKTFVQFLREYPVYKK